jgi:hypothetical protein
LDGSLDSVDEMTLYRPYRALVGKVLKPRAYALG